MSESSTKISRFQFIDQTMRSQFNVHQIELLNKSEDHSGHYQGEGDTHWELLLVSDDFVGLTRIQRHQKVYSLLGDEFQRGLHALSLRLLTVAEKNKTPIF